MFSSMILGPCRSALTSSRARSLTDNQSLDAYIRSKAQEYYFKLAAQELSDDQMRIEFSKDILIHFFMNYPNSNASPTHIQDFEAHLRENMTYLKTVYPQPKTSVLSRNGFAGIKDTDISESVEFDLMANISMNFHRGDRDSARMESLGQVQEFFNQIISNSQNAMESFTKLLMTDIPGKMNSQSKEKYERLMKQSWKFDLENDIAKTHHYRKELVSEKLFFPSFELFRVVESWVQHLEQIILEPDQYFSKTELLKMSITNRPNNGRIRKLRNQAKIFNKFDQMADSGSSLQMESRIETKPVPPQKIEEPEEESFFMKLINKMKRICNGSNDVTKMEFDHIVVEESTYQHSTQPTIENTENYANFDFKNSGYLYKHYVESLEELRSEMGYERFCENQLQFLRKGYMQTIKVVDKNKVKQKYTLEEKKVYSFCQNSYFFMEEVVIERLLKIIDSFLKLKEKSQNQYHKSRVFQDIQLINFKEQNIVSAFIICDEKLLVDVHNSILALSSTREVKVIKVQNRFGTAHNDTVILMKIKNNPIICKLRLCLEENRTGPESKQRALNNMHTYLNEMEKFPYGPISFLALILASKDQRVNYLQSIRKPQLEGNVRLAEVCHCGKGNISQRSSVNTFEKEIRNIISEDGSIKLDCYRALIPTSFVCGICERVVKKGESVIPVPSCSDCGFHICSECSFENSSATQISIYVALINSVVRIVDPCYFSELELSDPNKKNYNHSFTKDLQMIANNRPEIKKEVHYHIVLETTSFLRYGKFTNDAEFWEQLKQKINLRNLAEYKDVIKQDKFVGVLFRPRELLKEKGQPFIFLSYDSATDKLSKLTSKAGQERTVEVAINMSELKLSQNDAFLAFLWVFGESLISQFIAKVLQTNPFCVNKPLMWNRSLEQMRFSKSRISSHHIMR